MSVRVVRALARVVVIAVAAFWSGVAAADDLSPRPGAIGTQLVHSGSAPGLSVLPQGAARHEPVGTQPAGGRLLEKWNAATTELRIDIDIVAACRADIDACESASAGRMIGIVEDAGKREGRARIGQINRAINLVIAAASDKRQYGIEDKWASPLVTFTSGRGDCEDYALAKYAALRASGFAESDLRLLIVRLPQSQTDHAVLSVRHEGRWLVLDNRRFALLDLADLDAVPLFALRESDRPIHSTAAMHREPYLL